LDVIKKTRKRIYEIEIPTIIQQFRDFGISNNRSLFSIIQLYTQTTSEILRGHLDIANNTIFAIQSANPELMTDIKDVTPDDDEIEFIPCDLWKDEPELVTDEYSKIYLGNLLEKLKKEYSLKSNEIAKQKKSIEEVNKLFETYKQNPLFGDYESVKETALGEERFILMNTLRLHELECQIEKIIESVGGFSLEISMHDFKPTQFTIPTACDYCQQSIWGLGITKNGMTCRQWYL
jgi:hypothetical protein